MRDASLIVLAGGRSARMGTPKALLPFDGEPLIVHIVEALRPSFAQAIVVAAAAQELPPVSAMVVRDDVSYQGPVGGLYYGLRAASRDLSFVTACDAPFLNLGLIAHLLDTAAGYDAVVPTWGGHAQPLHAVYRRTVLPVFEEQLGRGELRLLSLLDKLRTRWVDDAAIRTFDPEGRSFFSINTPAEYQQAVARWEEWRYENRTERGNDAGGCS
jgi:molybdenum cofactor guanylyltransferase